MEPNILYIRKGEISLMLESNQGLLYMLEDDRLIGHRWNRAYAEAKGEVVPLTKLGKALFL